MAVRVWGAGSGAGSDGDLGNPANWTGDTLPTTGDDVYFDGTVSTAAILISNTSAWDLNSINVNQYFQLGALLGFPIYAAPTNVSVYDTGCVYIYSSLSLKSSFGSWEIPPSAINLIDDRGPMAGPLTISWSSIDLTSWDYNSSGLRGDIQITVEDGIYYDLTIPGNELPTIKVDGGSPSKSYANFNINKAGSDLVYSSNNNSAAQFNFPAPPTYMGVDTSAAIFLVVGGISSGVDVTITCSSITFIGPRPIGVADFTGFLAPITPNVNITATTKVDVTQNCFLGISALSDYSNQFKNSFVLNTPQVNFKDNSGFGSYTNVTIGGSTCVSNTVSFTHSSGSTVLNFYDASVLAFPAGYLFGGAGALSLSVIGTSTCIASMYFYDKSVMYGVVMGSNASANFYGNSKLYPTVTNAGWIDVIPTAYQYISFDNASPKVQLLQSSGSSF